MENLKKRLQKGETVQFSNQKEDHVTIWFSKRTSRFDLFLNGICVTSTKGFTPIVNKMEKIGGLEETVEM